MEAHVIVQSVFCFTLLFVCVLHSLCVCLDGHSALLHSPRFEWGPPFSVGDPISSLSTVYCLSPFPALGSSPLFFNEMGARSSVFSAKNNFFAATLAIFHMAFFFLSVKRHCMQAWYLGGVQGVLGVGGPRGHPGTRESRRARPRGILSYVKD